MKAFFVRIFKRFIQQTTFGLILALCILGGYATRARAEEKTFVAVIITGDLERYRLAHEAFLQKLHEAGIEDRLQVYVQTPNPDPMSWTNSIRKAVGIGAHVIVTYGAPATLAAKKEARGIPVLFADVYDPAALNILGAVGAPVKNLAGISGKTPVETLVKTFREISPAKTMGVLFSSTDEGSVLQWRRLGEVLPKVGLLPVSEDIASPAEIDAALESMKGTIDSLFVCDSALLHLHLKEIMDFAARQRLPVVSQIPTLCDQGALISLEADPNEQGEVAAELLISFLAGKSLGAMELRTPRKVSLVINMQVAHDLNLKVPFQALSVATRVIR